MDNWQQQSWKGLLRQMPSDLLRGASDAPAILSAFSRFTRVN